MAHKVTASSGTLLHGPFRLHDPLDLWWVHGELYIDLDKQPDAGPVLKYFSRKPGYVITADQTVPAAYLSAVASLRRQAQEGCVRTAVALQDGAEPGRLNYPPAA